MPNQINLTDQRPFDKKRTTPAIPTDRLITVARMFWFDWADPKLAEVNWELIRSRLHKLGYSNPDIETKTIGQIVGILDEDAADRASRGMVAMSVKTAVTSGLISPTYGKFEGASVVVGGTSGSPTLNDSEDAIVTALREIGRPAKANEIAMKAFGQKVATSHTKEILSNLVKRSVLTKIPDKGYGLPEWSQRE